MSNSKKSTKRVVKTVKTVKTAGKDKKSIPTKSSSKANRTSASSNMPLIFNKENYILMGVGVLLIALGFILMTGGGSGSPDVFDADRLYSFRRITLAPFIIILGLLVEVYAIFKK